MPGSNSGVSVLVWLSLSLGLRSPGRWSPGRWSPGRWSPGRWSLNDGVGDEAEPAVLQRTDNIRGMLRPPCQVTGPGRSGR
jgi:hypothetical protein